MNQIKTHEAKTRSQKTQTTKPWRPLLLSKSKFFFCHLIISQTLKVVIISRAKLSAKKNSNGLDLYSDLVRVCVSDDALWKQLESSACQEWQFSVPLSRPPSKAEKNLCFPTTNGLKVLLLGCSLRIFYPQKMSEKSMLLPTYLSNTNTVLSNNI